MDILIKKTKLENIDSLVLLPQDIYNNAPIVIMYHGYLGQKEMHLPQSYFMASHGFVVILPDAWGHGDRASGMPNFIESVEHSANEVDTIISCCEENGWGDVSKVGLAGGSMGGCITFQYLAGEDRKIKAAASTIGTPDWVSILKTQEALALFTSVGLAETASDMEGMSQIAAERQPLGKIKNMVGIPILIQNGALDTLVPADAVKDFFEEYTNLDGGASGSELVVYPNLAHADHPELNIKMVEWFKRHLQA